jgi:hypothetical protein
MSAFEKISAGLKQALSFARAECEHEWITETTRHVHDGRWIIKSCKKCRVRVSSLDRT